jgi:hypothetical protein
MECVRPLLNGGAAPSREACCAALDMLYKLWVENGDNTALHTFGVHSSPAVVTVAHRDLRDELARFAEVLREVGLLPRYDVDKIEGHTRRLWHTMQDRVDCIATALECFCQMWYCRQQLHQCRHQCRKPPGLGGTPSSQSSLSSLLLSTAVMLFASLSSSLSSLLVRAIPTTTTARPCSPRRAKTTARCAWTSASDCSATHRRDTLRRARRAHPPDAHGHPIQRVPS